MIATHLTAKLLDKEQELNAIFEGVPLMMVLLDCERRVIRINRQAVEFLGRPEVMMLGRCFGEAVGCFHAEESEKGCGFGALCRQCRVKAMAVRALQLGETTKGQEVRHTFKVDGQLKELTLLVTAIPLTLREEPAALVTFQDVTAQRAWEEERQQAQRLESIGTLASGIAHDFNNILAAIIGYTDLALLGSQGNQQVSDDLAEVRKAASRASGLIRKILTFSRRHHAEKMPIQVSSIITEAVGLLRATLPADIEIRQNLSSEATIMADPTQLHQLVMNLGTNAYHAMADTGGTLDLGLQEVCAETDGLALPASRYLRLTVSDTGHGMTPEVMARIFEPYFTTKGMDKGSGLGLAMAHGIVAALQGRITVTSTPDEGTTFTVYLPAAEIAPRTEIRPNASAVPLNAQGWARIMVVDDETAILNVVRRHLELDGYRVEIFVNGLEAWQALSAKPESWDILLTDQNLPGLSGTRLAAKAHKLTPELPIIIWSGSFSVTEAETPPGIFAILRKPVDYTELRRCLNGALGACRT